MNADVTFAGMIPSSIEVEVSGIFSSGMFEFDNSLSAFADEYCPGILPFQVNIQEFP